MRVANPYLNFPGNTEEAFNFYRSVFGGAFALLVRFRDFGGDGMGVPEADGDRIAHISLPIGNGQMLMGTDSLEGSPKPFTPGNNFYIMVEADSAAEAEALFNALADGGRVEMPLQRTNWAEQYGCLADRFGVQWMLSYTGEVRFSTGSS